MAVISTLQSGAAYHSLGFEDDNLGSSPGWWAATVATYCPSRPGNYPNSYLQNLANDRPPRSVYVCENLKLFQEDDIESLTSIFFGWPPHR